MSEKDKVLFNGEEYTILYDYKNGQYEIKRVGQLFKVELVHKSQLVKV